MKYAIEIQDMTAAELAAVTAFLTSLGASPVTKTSKVVAELAAATGVTGGGAADATAPTITPPPAMIPPPAPAPAPQVVTDPFSAPPPTAGAGGELDARGVPHNPTFHAETKRKNGDGSWAKRKGVDKDGCARYEAQYITAGPNQAPTPPAGIPAPVMTTTPAPSAAETTAKFAPHLVQPPVVTPPAGDPFAAPAPTPAAPAAPTPPAPALEEVTYNQWYELYMNLLTAGKISPEQYTAIAERYGAIENTMKFMDDADARARSYADMMALTR
jgi:hypothetical protein